ncbi:branched-chain amino acid aminotransferase [Pseudomonadota bacterium]|jgi:branched-chain amino acid aminotransferase|nr:branched-chain amino acid aminotransferase [Xanthomonadales bacterium]
MILEEILKGYSLPPKLGFGQTLAPVMFRAEYRDGSWDEGELTPYAPISIDPAATVLQYAQQAFEGLKAYKVRQSSPALFRPEMNYFRLRQSSRRMCMPAVPRDVFARGLSEVTMALADFIPGGSGQSLYLRPFLMGTGPCLSVKSSDAFTFLVIASPSDTYFSQPIRVMVEREDCRAAVGGTGADKVGGNYAASLQATTACIELGFDQPLWLDPRERCCIEELSGMNLVAVVDGELHTPRLSGSILPGVTRVSLLELARHQGHTVVERSIPIDELLDDIRSGRCSEFFACGTAAIVAPISAVGERDGSVVELPKTGQMAARLRSAILDIQEGRSDDPFGWMVDAADFEALLFRMSPGPE